MSDGDKVNYLYCLDMWFEEKGEYEKLQDYIVTNKDKGAVGANVIDAFEKLLIKAKGSNKKFVKEYALVVSQFLTNSKEHPEVFVNELLIELNIVQKNDCSNDFMDQLEKLERELRIRVQQAQHNPINEEYLKLILCAIEEEMNKFLFRIQERALLSDLKKIAKYLYKSLNHIYRLVGNMIPPIKNLLITLFKNCIYMDLPPPRILKKQTKPNTGTSFKVSVRFLIDEEYIKNSPPIKLKGYYLHQTHLSSFDPEKHQPFEIPLVDGEEEFVGDLCSFKKLKVNPGKQRGTQNPRAGCRRSEEKGLLVFRAEISPKSFFNESINVFLLSKPVVLIVHTNQQAEAEGTILWDDHFPIVSRGHFETQSEVEIKMFIEAVSQFFYNNTRRALTGSNKLYLESILYNLSIPRKVITFQKVFRDKLPGKNFTFWEWIYAAFRLIKDDCNISLWKENVIHGFISYDESLKLFQEKSASPGCWMLRFSESVLGGITVSLVDDQHQLVKWEPLTAKHLSGSPLSKQLLEYVDLRCFIDGRDKHAVLGHLLNCGEVHSGYVPRGMRGLLAPIYNNNVLYTPSHDGQEDYQDEDQDMEILDANEMNEVMQAADGFTLTNIDLGDN